MDDKKAKLLDQTLRSTYHEQDDDIVLAAYQDVEPHLEYAAALRRVDSEERGAFGKRADFHHTMSVPFNVILEVAQKLGIKPGDIFDSEKQRRIYRELKGPDYKLFRTTIDKAV